MNLGDTVSHRRYGQGTILQMRHRGLEVEVRFVSGRQLWLRVEDIDVLGGAQHEASIVSEPLERPSKNGPSPSRALVEGLRLGIVPQRLAGDFIIGRETEAKQLDEWLGNETSNVMLVVGGYGSGKTHFLEYAYWRALEKGFATALVSVDYNEAPFYRPKHIYERCVTSLRYRIPEGTGTGGYRMLLRRAFEAGALVDHSYFIRVMGSQPEEVWEWIEARAANGRPVPTFYQNFRDYPCMYDFQNAGNLYCYLLSGLSCAARLSDLRGLVLFFDEAEAIDFCAYPYQRNKGRSFVEALIRVASNDKKMAGPPIYTHLEYCRFADQIPFAYKLPCHLKVAFACTPVVCDVFPDRLDYQRIELVPLGAEALAELMNSISIRYAEAYGSPPLSIQHAPHFTELSTLIAQGRPIRSLVKGCIELMDVQRLSRPRQQVYAGDEHPCTDMAKMRRLLPRSWSPFFGRFGGLTPIQLKTIPLVLKGGSVIVASPTASGKTEAVAAPIAETLADSRPDGLEVIYVVPTRALANDTLRRIADPLSSLDIEVIVKHGDNPQLPAHGMPNWLITTPESLDSLLCRHPAEFGKLRVAVVDEIHLLDNTFRGDQLRILLERARRLTQSGALVTHLLSATLSSPAELALRYSPDAEIVEVPGQRSLEHWPVRSLAEAIDLAKTQRWQKLLCFCNMREAVERYGNEISVAWQPYPVVVHHGSLDRREREEAERVMQEAPTAACVCTSTLEIGVDIGDIDAVVLLEVPWSVSSFLQRVGRGNRRSDVINAVTVATSCDEESAFKTMVAWARNGELPADSYQPDLSVCVQQTLSYLYQNPQGVDPDEVVGLLSPLCDRACAVEIISHLVSSSKLEERRGALFAASAVMDMGKIGKIHSNIPDSQRYRVVDEATGREIGTISGVFDKTFVLARRFWQVTHVSEGIVRVRSFKGQAEAAQFPRQRGTGAFHSWLPPSLQ